MIGDLTVRASAHGKVNLHLGVGDLRDDGYHDLTTVFQAVALEEVVTLRPVPQPQGVAALTVAGPDAHLVPTDSTNLAWRAVDLVREQWLRHSGVNPADVPGVEIHIDKGVPVAGGMAGGSADAAAALVAAVEMYYRRLPPILPGAPDVPPPDAVAVRDLGARLGADVPFCLLGGTALGTGRGEELVSVIAEGPFHWALATDKRGLSTPTVFAQLDRQREAAHAGSRPDPRAGDPTELLRAVRSADPAQLAPLLVNDLQPPALSLLPGLRQTLRAAKEAGALAAIVSGSGPTVAMLCADAHHAVDVAAAVSVAGLASATLTTTSPAPGARLI